MFKFIKKTVLFLIAILLTSFILVLAIYFATKNVYADNYQKGFVYQYRRLESAPKDQEKIVVFGGSYLAFSLNTKQMEELIGMPTYELGVQSNMGQCYTIELVEQNIGQGDIVVFPFEDFAADDYGMDLICLSLDGQLDMTLDFLKAHPKELITTVPKASFRRIVGQLRDVNNSDSAYMASGFDQEYAYYKLDRPEPVVEKESFITNGYAYTMQDVDPSCIQVLNQLNEICQEKGATLLITYAPMCVDAVASSDEQIEDYESSLAEELDAPIICSLNDCFYDYKYVYNGYSHLNNAGMEKYTSDLAAMLSEYID